MQAQERREQIIDGKGNASRAADWLKWIMVVHAFKFTAKHIGHTKRQKRKSLHLFPHVIVRLRGLLRKIRMRKLQHEVAKPSVATLRSDKMLNLFSDAHLRHVIDQMRLQYFFENERILFMGSEDAEGYVLQQGSADVMMGGTRVFTLRAGMCFGIVGMISGEPRTASIVAREPTLVWMVTRDAFESFGGGAQDAAVTEAAHRAIVELRQANLLNVYRSQLDAAFMTSYPSLAQMPAELIQNICQQRCIPKVVKMDTIVLHPTQGLSKQSPVILMRGRLRVKLRHENLQNVLRNPQSGVVFEFHEHLRHLFDVPARGGSRQALEHPACAFRGFDASALTSAAVDSTLLEIRAPALLNIAPLFLGYQVALPFVVETACDCDMLQLSKETIRQQDVLDLATVRQNVQNLCTAFIPTPSRGDLARWLLRSVSRTKGGSCGAAVGALLAGSAAGAVLLQEEKWVYMPGDFLTFEPASTFLVHVVLSGELEGGVAVVRGGAPSVWPSVAESFFATVNATVRARTRVEVLRIRRRNLIAWLYHEVKDANVFRGLVGALAREVMEATQRPPTFSSFDLHDVTVQQIAAMRSSVSCDGVRRLSGNMASGKGASLLSVLSPLVDTSLEVSPVVSGGASPCRFDAPSQCTVSPSPPPAARPVVAVSPRVTSVSDNLIPAFTLAPPSIGLGSPAVPSYQPPTSVKRLGLVDLQGCETDSLQASPVGSPRGPMPRGNESRRPDPPSSASPLSSPRSSTRHGGASACRSPQSHVVSPRRREPPEFVTERFEALLHLLDDPLPRVDGPMLSPRRDIVDRVSSPRNNNANRALSNGEEERYRPKQHAISLQALRSTNTRDTAPAASNVRMPAQRPHTGRVY